MFHYNYILKALPRNIRSDLNGTVNIAKVPLLTTTIAVAKP